jgi:hypothetical protein
VLFKGSRGAALDELVAAVAETAEGQGAAEGVAPE